MSGGGLAYDGAGSLFFSTGNGYAAQLPASGKPVSGRSPPTALEEAVVNMKLHDDGTMEPVDFFMPWEKTQLDGADKDLGTRSRRRCNCLFVNTLNRNHSLSIATFSILVSKRPKDWHHHWKVRKDLSPECG